MSGRAITGSRIRDRRTSAGLKQADLARRVGISASYLNLIEHNRRRIGGKLLGDIARTLGTRAAELEEGPGAALSETLTDAARAIPSSGAELPDIDEFTRRFPGWARLAGDQRDRIAALERRVEAMSDRVAHDPHLAENLHDILSAATAVRSAASILAGTPDIDPAWRRRFQANIRDDAGRLAERTRRLVDNFDALARENPGTAQGLDKAEEWFAERGNRSGELESGAESPELLAEEVAPGSARVRDWFVRYADEARMLPSGALTEALREVGGDPLDLSERLGIRVPVVLRRLAGEGGDTAPSGLVEVDAAGAVTARLRLEGFPVPRFGAACALWPVFEALSRPGDVIRRGLETTYGLRLSAFAAAEVVGTPSYDAPRVLRSTMLIRADAGESAGGGGFVTVGSTCRVCPAADCPARREAAPVSPPGSD